MGRYSHVTLQWRRGCGCIFSWLQFICNKGSSYRGSRSKLRKSNCLPFGVVANPSYLPHGSRVVFNNCCTNSVVPAETIVDYASYPAEGAGVQHWDTGLIVDSDGGAEGFVDCDLVRAFIIIILRTFAVVHLLHSPVP